VQFALRGSNVRCDFTFDDTLRPGEIDEGQIAQVLHNLMINAEQAMPDGGTVFVRVEGVTLPADNSFALDSGEYVKISIRDQGVGIQSEYLKKIFDPYFSTKQKGSGLGLAVAYSIVTKHDGQLTVESSLGQGTTFTIFLPASERSLSTRCEDQNGLLEGDGNILVMDDEAFIREVVSAMLKQMGYNVAVAKTVSVPWPCIVMPWNAAARMMP
jgi:K+-sensing histidine kinase KdpD